MSDGEMPKWVETSIHLLCLAILSAYALIFFAFGVDMLQRSGVSVVQLVPTFLGVLLGFISARIGEWVKSKIDKKKKRKTIACGVIRCLERNLRLLNQVTSEFAAKSIPTFPMDGGFLEYARNEIHDLIPDVEHAAAIEHARYEIAHFDTKLEMLRTSAIGQPGQIHISNQIQVASNHLPIVETAIRSAHEVAKKYEKG
jgi:hypothetical protein